jgi:hypothetical protein
LPSQRENNYMTTLPYDVLLWMMTTPQTKKTVITY